MTPPGPSDPPCWHDLDVALLLLDQRDGAAVMATGLADDRVTALLNRYAARLDVLRSHADAMPTTNPLDPDPAAALL